MARRLLLTFATTAWLTGFYLLYAHFVSPIIEPAQLTAQEATKTAAPIEIEEHVPGAHHAVATEFLPHQDWAKTAQNQFRIGDMFVYADKVEQQAGQAEIRFKPFALVWKDPKRKPGDPPLRITADAAVIQFESAVDLANQQKGNRPISGSLEGAVRIEGPNGLLIVGRGFTFSEQALRLWSDSDILFHYGPHHGTGHGLQVDFLPASENQIVKDHPRLGGLRTVSVLRQVVLNLMGEPAVPDQPRRSPLKDGDQLAVQSDGRMQYDLEANLITFDHRVRVRHPQPNAVAEGLNCDLLTLVLSNPKSVPPVENADPTVPANEIALTSNEQPSSQQDMADWLPTQLNVEKMLADGAGKRRVEVFSQGRDLHCNTAQVEYDLAKRILTLRDPATVDVLRGAQEIHAPEIMLTLEDNNQDIRLAVARGAGSATSRLADGRTVSAKWQKQLVKSFDEKLQLDFVELQGDSSMALGMEYELTGDSLRVWFTPLAKGGNPVAVAAATPSPAAAPLRVERVAGVGQVAMKSPQATAHTKWLDVRFQATDLPPTEPGQSGSLFALPGGTSQSAPGQRGPVRPGQPRQAPAETPLNLQADSIRAVILRDRRDDRRMELSDLWADEAVTVTQPLRDGQPPVQITGSHLHVESPQPQQQLVQVLGSPALIRSDVSRLEGTDIRFDRQHNMLHVMSAGLLQYPVNTALDGQALDQAQLLQVKWAERLEFDGQTANFYEKVEASLRQMVMRCNAMHVSLSNPVRFDDPQLAKLGHRATELSRIFCENKVEIDSAEYQGNIIVSRSFGRLGQFVVDNISGKTEAQGPGHFMEWRRGQQRSDSRPNTNQIVKAAPKAEAPHEWTYSRIDFQGRMKGNLRDRFTTFEDHVEIVYGPVPHATDRFEADELPEGGAAITCNALKVEQHAQTDAAAAYITLSAEGNTKLELQWDGQPLHAQADEVKFDESKDYYLLRSIGAQKVIVIREPTTNDPRGRIKCARVDIRNPRDPSRRELKVTQATELNGVQN